MLASGHNLTVACLPLQDLQVFEVTMLGLQGLSGSYGAEAKEVVAAKAAMRQLLSWSVQTLDAALDGDVTFQARALGWAHSCVSGVQAVQRLGVEFVHVWVICLEQLSGRPEFHEGDESK